MAHHNNNLLEKSFIQPWSRVKFMVLTSVKVSLLSTFFAAVFFDVIKQPIRVHKPRRPCRHHGA